MRSPSVQPLLFTLLSTASASLVTPWDTLSTALKGHARTWFINRATEKGIDWEGKSNYYVVRLDELKQRSNELVDAEVSYPKYYTRPFHGYDDGNLNWQAACELEASTESMSSGYFSDVDPAAGAARMRSTFTSNIVDFAQGVGARPLAEFIDMGCSIGISTEETLRRIPSLKSGTGVDLSPYFLSVARHKAERSELPLHFVHANVDSLDMPASADLVTVAFVFHEMPPEVIAQTIRAAYRTLRPGGVFAVLDLDPKTLRNSLSGFRKWGFESTEPHIFTYYNVDLSSALESGGFENVDERPNDPYNHGWFGKKPEEQWGI